MAEHRVARFEELQDRAVTVVDAGGREIGLVRVGERVTAFENRCVHQGGPVCHGEVLGKVELALDECKRVVGQRFSEREFHLVCPWHGWEYDVATGECSVDRNLKLCRFPVEVRDGEVFVDV